MDNSRLTILVNSCDNYEDIWFPFFTLLKKYLPLDVPIILNTESKNFQFDGLNIQCVHIPKRGAVWPYGKRLKHALSHIKTEYTLLLLDDFFLRTLVDVKKLQQIMDWMDTDPNIVCFNFEATKVYADWECDKYSGFRRYPPGNNFMLNLQAAIWRTSGLEKYWRNNVSPWEWEVYCNALTTKYQNDKFYCVKDWENLFLDYGHHKTSDLWGIVKGKWVMCDVQPFFEREGIDVDFSTRGEYPYDRLTPYTKSHDTRREQFGLIYRCLGLFSTIKYFFFRVRYKMCMYLKKPVQTDYFLFLQEKQRRKFFQTVFKTEHEGVQW